MRLLDIVQHCVTPAIVIQDAHKHIGTDKGLSTIIGTPGIMSYVAGQRRIGAQPKVADLVRAIADVRLVGKNGYVKLYSDLNDAIERAVHRIEFAGMHLIHGHKRIKGSTVIAVEDPSGAVAKRMKKLGYSTSPIYKVCPAEPTRCQTGWQLSFTPHHLRLVKNGTKSAIDAFVDDLLIVHSAVKNNLAITCAQTCFRENSLLALLIAGNVDPFIYGLLEKEGIGRAIALMIVRRFATAQLDSGSVCTSKREDPVGQLARRTALQAALTAVFVAFLRRRNKSSRKLIGRSAL